MRLWALFHDLGWQAVNLAVPVVWIQRNRSSVILQFQLGTSDKSVYTQEDFLRTYGEPHSRSCRQIRHVDCVGSNTFGVNFGNWMDCANVETLEPGPGVSVSDVHFEWKENVRSGAVIFDFKSHHG